MPSAIVGSAFDDSWRWRLRRAMWFGVRRALSIRSASHVKFLCHGHPLSSKRWFGVGLVWRPRAWLPCRHAGPDSKLAIFHTTSSFGFRNCAAMFLFLKFGWDDFVRLFHLGHLCGCMRQFLCLQQVRKDSNMDCPCHSERYNSVWPLGLRPCLFLCFAIQRAWRPLMFSVTCGSHMEVGRRQTLPPLFEMSAPPVVGELTECLVSLPLLALWHEPLTEFARVWGKGGFGSKYTII